MKYLQGHFVQNLGGNPDGRRVNHKRAAVAIFNGHRIKYNEKSQYYDLYQ